MCLSSKIFLFSPRRSIFPFIKIYTHILLSTVNCVSIIYIYIFFYIFFLILNEKKKKKDFSFFTWILSWRQDKRPPLSVQVCIFWTWLHLTCYGNTDLLYNVQRIASHQQHYMQNYHLLDIPLNSKSVPLMRPWGQPDINLLRKDSWQGSKKPK